MSKNSTLSFIALAAILITGKVHAQDFTFSQFYEQPLLRNPALAGVFTGDIRASVAHRSQWGSVTVPFKTSAMSVEHKIPMGGKNDFLTIASQMSIDVAGDLRLRRTQILPAINYHKSLSNDNDTYLSLAFMGGPVSSQFDASKLKMGDQFRGGEYNAANPSAQPITNSGYSYWDLSTGLSLSTSFNDKTRVYVAAGLSHVTNPTIKSVTGSTENFLSPRLSFNAGINAPSGERSRIMGFIDYFTQNNNKQILGGLLYGMTIREYDDGNEPDLFYIGSFMRWGDALIPTVKMEFEHFSIGVSYDVNISKLKVVSNWRGGLELTATYRGFLKIRNSSIDKTRCVRF